MWMITTLVLVTVLWQWFILLEPTSFLASWGGGSPILNALYFTVITVTTVGYGDITAHSDVGMILSMFAALLGVFQIAFLINAIANSQTLNEHEKAALTKIDQSQAAAKAISHSIKFYGEKKKHYGSMMPAGRS